MPTAPQQLTTNNGTLIGAVDGSNNTYLTAGVVPAAGMVFLNGVLLTSPADFTASGFHLTVGPTPQVGDVVTDLAYSSALNTGTLPLNLPIQFTTNNGSISGTMDGANNVFTLVTSALVTELMLFWNGDMMTDGVDYSWSCLQPSSAGAWVTTITMMNGQYPGSGDVLTAQVFGS